MTFSDEDLSCLKSGCFVVLPVLQFELDIEGADVEETVPLSLECPPGHETNKAFVTQYHGFPLYIEMGVGIITVILVKTCKRMDLRNIFF
jgi:hypothetical protein